jgi:PAS domain S-box-containing protein
MAERVEDIFTTAFRHGLQGAVGVDEAAADLAHLAQGDPALIAQAIALVEWAVAWRPSAVGDYARQALERALSLAQDPAGRGDREPLSPTIADAAPTMLAYWGADRRNVTANAAYKHWYGWSPRDMRGLHMSDVLGEDVYEGVLPHIDGVLTGSAQRFERRLVDTTGVTRLAQATYSPDIVGGRVAGFSVIVTDATSVAACGAAPTDARRGDDRRPPLRVRAIIVDGDALARAGLRAFLASAPDIDVVGEGAAAEDALAAVRGARPDVVVMDARTRGVDGFLATRRASSSRGSAFPGVVVLASSALDEYLFDPVGHGASALLAKRARPEELIDAVRAVARGDQVGARDDRRQWPGEVPVNGGRWRPSKREREVLDLVRHGLSNAEIARRLFISKDTVKTHLKHLYGKIGVRDRQHLIIAAYEDGSLGSPH